MVFELNEVEEQKYREFTDAHYEMHKGMKAFVVTTSFTPTGIGNHVEVECSICKAKKDITDYDCW